MVARAAEGAVGDCGLFRVLGLDEVDSTNSVIKRALREGEPEGLVVRAWRQTGGYGRQGRAWTSPLGGLYCSWLLRPDVPAEELPTLSLVVGLAFRRALAELAGERGDRVMVKWPNDVVLAGKPTFSKLVGISLEVTGGGVCVGTGVNVVPPDGAPVSVGGKNVAGYVGDVVPGLAADGVERAVDRVFEAVASSFAECYGLWVREGFGALSGDFSACHILTGTFVDVRDRAGGALGQGVVKGVDGQGRLVLVDADSTERHIASGEAHIV